MKKKKIFLVITIIMILFVILGTTYALFSYVKVFNKNQVAITGDIYMNYLTGNQINITNCVPMSKEEALASDDNFFNFQIVGKNTSNKDIYYGISLENDIELTGKTRIKPKNIAVYLTSDDTVLLDGVRYKSFDNTKIWVDTIPANTNSQVTKNYSLKIWIDENTLISDTEANADYTTDEWANSYVSLKVKVDGKLDKMNIPLSIETSDTYVENNKAYFITKISNYLDISEAGKFLETPDNMKLEITGTNSDVLFAYKDSEGNEVTTGSESLILNYNFTTNKIVEVKVFVIPKNDANGETDINIKLTKNGTENYEMVQRLAVKGNNYCLNNGFNKLGDCILVSENLSDDVETAKTYISNKGTVNLDDTAPSYTYVEETTTNVSNAYTASSGYKYYFGTGYSFNSTTGTFKLTGTITDNLSDTYLNYYTCGVTNNGYTTCSTIYKILGTDVATQTITLADKITYKIASTLRSEVGLYATEDDYGTSYFYRGDVQNNNVYFGGFYWKIVRMNGDGSIRLIYSGTTPNATGNNTSINNKAYQYSDRYPDPTYVGYMRGEDFALQTSSETTYSVNGFSKYYFADNYAFDEATKTFTLSGNIISEGKTFSEMNDLGTEGFAKYPYTCMQTSSTATCQVLIKVHSYLNMYNVRAQYIAYSSTSLQATRTDDVDSNIKSVIDSWYLSNIARKNDSNGASLTSYIVDGTFCNDRSFYRGNGYSLVPGTYYSGYKRLYSDSKKSATLKCSNESDKFSTTASRGNAKLKYPVALIIADEVALAGGKNEIRNFGYYLKTGGYFWTMTPSFLEAKSYVHGINSVGEFTSWFGVAMSYGVRPVINLRSDVLISQGDGTIENPYILKIA